MSATVHNPGRFLAGIAGLLRNHAGQYLLLKRSADRDVGAGVWECVTGRVNQGEGFEEALHREVMEETGLPVRIDLLIGLSHFYRGKPIADNELQGVVFGCSIDGDGTVRHGPEHTEYRWASAQSALELLTAPDPGTRWFRQTIERADLLYSMLPAAWAETTAAGVTLGAASQSAR
ncbi:MAG: NUDIX domain-containing protein [Gemmatimonadetes bacterium]|jgi:8-oxo-dGTP diphosphatase|nr:NUDIX domain-containing protein [Gemmatimonadota bacterium]